MARPIDADAVLDRYYAEFEKQDICDGSQDRNWLMQCIDEAPPLTPPNEPLTLAQLREMVDEPAYLYMYDTALDSGWHIIKAVTEDKIIFRGWNTVYVPVSSLGRCFDLYAYPPAHIDREPCEYCNDQEDPCLKDGCFRKNRWKCSFTCDKYREFQERKRILEKSKFCPRCGRPLTEEAEAALKGEQDG